MTDRYVVRATWPDGVQELVGWRGDMTQANRLLIAALNEGAVYAHVTDTRPSDPNPVTAEERDALATIMPKMPRTME
jgi:hypothetical protein